MIMCEIAKEYEKRTGLFHMVYFKRTHIVLRKKNYGLEFAEANEVESLPDWLFNPTGVEQV